MRAAAIDWNGDRVWAAICVIGAWLAVAPAWIGLPMAHDVVAADWWQVFVGYADAIGQHARAGELPRLAVGPHLGTNLAGQIEAGPFYLPGWVLYPVLGPFVGLLALYALHVAVGALGGFVLGRVSGRGPGPAALLGVAYGASGFVVGHVKHPNIVGSSVWLPWALAGVILAGRGPWPGLPLLALASAAPWFPGHPQIAYYSTLATVVVATIVHARRWRVLVACAGAMAVGGLLSALSVVPTLALARGSFRSAPDWGFASRFALDLADLLYFVAPTLRGVPYAGTWRPWFSAEALAWEDYAYVGLPTLGLALLAIPRDSTSRRVALGIVALSVFALGPATPLYGAAWSVIPGLDAFRFPQRALWLVGLGLAWLAARGLESASNEPRVHRWTVLLLVADLAIAHRVWLPAVQIGDAVPSALVAQARADRPDARVYVVGADEGWHAAFTAMTGPATFAPLVRLPSANLAGVYGVESPDGYVALQPAATAWFWAPGNRDRMPGAPAMPHVGDDGALVARRRLERAGVTHVITARPIAGLAVRGTSEGFVLVALDAPWPAGYTTDGWVGADEAQARDLSENSDAVVLEAEARGGTGALWPVPPPPPGVTETWDVAGRAGALVVARSWDPGWRATVDGAPVPVTRANGWQRAVILPGGAQTVVFTYDPPGLGAGAALAAVGALGWIALAVASRRRGGSWTSN